MLSDWVAKGRCGEDGTADRLADGSCDEAEADEVLEGGDAGVRKL